ncbi:hypothetical protein LCGC14_1120080 [marine sediment metagenome]|uniref:Uncharacterized protein n=1 Tax=marine sediment metagenome TaxID=412755 RepID=A0A0F9QA05_9ZZZZ
MDTTRYTQRVAKTPCPRCSKVGRQITGGPPRCFNTKCPVGYYYPDGKIKPKLWDGYGG